MHVNSDNPIVSTMSQQFVDASKGARGWEGQAWDREIAVPMVTLDSLIAAHGEPTFIKIDVEGFEGEALAGLSRRVRALSFEFTTIQREVALACLRRCVELGYRQFNAVIGETHDLVFDAPIDAQGLAAWIEALPHEANSGDIYAT